MLSELSLPPPLLEELLLLLNDLIEGLITLDHLPINLILREKLENWRRVLASSTSPRRGGGVLEMIGVHVFHVSCAGHGMIKLLQPTLNHELEGSFRLGRHFQVEILLAR